MFPADEFYPLTFAEVAASNPAWFCENPQDMFQPAPLVYSNLEQAGVAGTLPRAPIIDQRIVDLRWSMKGSVTPAGEPYDDPIVGLAANKRFFEAAYGPADSNGCIVCAGTDPVDQDVEGLVQFGNPTFTAGLFECGVVVSVIIVGGALESVGS